MASQNTLETILKFTSEGADALKSGFAAAEDSAQTFGDKIKGISSDTTIFGTQIGTASDALGAMGISLPTSYMQAFGMAIKGATDFLADAVQGTVDYAFQVRELGRTIGATPEEASKLINAADDVVVSYEEMSSAMAIAIRNGVNPTIEGMGELADQYVAIESPIERTRFLLDTFGRSGAAMAPLMELGAEGIRELGDGAEEVGLVLDQQALDATRNYEVAMDGLGDTLEGLKVKMALELIPAINMDAENLMMLMGITNDLNDAFSGLTAEQAANAAAVFLAKPSYDSFLSALTALSGATDDLEGYTEDLSMSIGGSKDSIVAAKDAAIEYHDEMVDLNTVHGDVIASTSFLNGEFNAQTIAAQLVQEGIAGYNMSLIESKRFELDLAFAMGEVTQAEYDEYQAQLDRLNNLEILNGLVEDGKIAEEDYAQALADGQVTRQEVLNYLWQAGYDLLEIQRIMGELDGTVVDVGVNVGVQGPGAGLVADPDWQPGQDLDPGEVGALGAMDLGGGTSEGRGGGIGASSTTYNYNLNIYTSAPVEDIAGQFELLMRISEGG